MQVVGALVGAVCRFVPLPALLLGLFVCPRPRGSDSPRLIVRLYETPVAEHVHGCATGVVTTAWHSYFAWVEYHVFDLCHGLSRRGMRLVRVLAVISSRDEHATMVSMSSSVMMW